MSAPPPPGYWGVVRLLLAASFRRAAGRRRRQGELFSRRAANKTNLEPLGFVLGVAFLALLHVVTAFAVAIAVSAGQHVMVERRGQIVVDQWFRNAISHPEWVHWRDSASLDPQSALSRAYHVEAAQIARRQGGDPHAVEAQLRQAVTNHGTASMISLDDASGLRLLGQAGPLPGLLGLLVVLVWFVMMALQGEGLELDVQRRRHPIWEWLFSHPVPQGAVFLSEMLSPLTANPIYFSAPLVPGFLFGFIYGKAAGILAAAVVGIPVTIAAACVGKALEAAVTLRFAPRSRGAMIGLMGWLGYATMLALTYAAAMALADNGKTFILIARALAPMGALPWPYLGWLLGALPDGTFSLVFGIAIDILICAALVAGSVRFSVWGAGRGLASNPGTGQIPGERSSHQTGKFRGDALYRKEILWFARDRSALVQAIMIPLSLAAVEAFNYRLFLEEAAHHWNGLCAAAALFGTYFLLVMGPKSLASEGAALWISLTWPQGLEKLLRAKARLWALLSTCVVGVVLIYAAIQFPTDAWRIALTGAAWVLFARSIAAKMVTLATVPSESGEVQKVPMGRRLAAQLGMLTFSIGIFSEQWNLVVIGVVYSAVTAAAMWQNFRARLPYLYDPWSEELPTPPTLMHAMVAVSLLVEFAAVITGVMLVLLPRSEVAVAQAAIYGVCAVAVSVGTAKFLGSRDVAQRDIWNWPDAVARQPVQPSRRSIEQKGRNGLLASLIVGVTAGGGLGLLALAYLMVLKEMPGAAGQLQRSSALMRSVPHLRESLFVTAVLIAPFAEEFLFRGLLYRALDREWGGWRAVLGSAAFFAAYHPVLAWPPVFLLGAINAVLFKRTGRLASAVALHMTYNAIVLP